MKRIQILIFTLILLVNHNSVVAQEWSSFRYYKKITGNKVLLEGNWLKRDRKRKTDTWKKANIYNLNIEKGYLKYKTISEIRDFYLWYDRVIKEKGDEINSIGVSAIVVGQLSMLDNFFVRFFLIRNKEAVYFGNEGSKRVFKFAFPQIRTIYFSDKLLKGKKAKEWDKQFGTTEQCVILKPIYDSLSEKGIKKLERMSKGKGIYHIGVREELRFKGDILNCISRYEHGSTRVLSFYLKQKK